MNLFKKNKKKDSTSSNVRLSDLEKSGYDEYYAYNISNSPKELRTRKLMSDDNSVKSKFKTF